MNTFSMNQIRKDALDWVSSPGRTRLQLARQAGIEWKSLDRFLTNPKAGLSGRTIEKLWKVIYCAPSTEVLNNDPR